jgi:hypothetical protein
MANLTQRTYAGQHDVGGVGPTFRIAVDAVSSTTTNLLLPFDLSTEEPSTASDARCTAQARFDAIVRAFSQRARPIKVEVTTNPNDSNRAGNRVIMTFGAEAAAVFGLTPAVTAPTETLGVAPWTTTKTIQAIGADGAAAGSILAEIIAINYGSTNENLFTQATPVLFPGETAKSGQAVIAAADLDATVL